MPVCTSVLISSSPPPSHSTYDLPVWWVLLEREGGYVSTYPMLVTNYCPGHVIVIIIIRGG